MYTHKLIDEKKAIEYGFSYVYGEAEKMCLVTDDLRVVLINNDDTVWCLNDELLSHLTEIGILELNQ